MKSIISLLLLTASMNLSAFACTYSEAIMAYEQGNQKRALFLMQIAAREGDPRAVEKLLEMQMNEERDNALYLVQNGGGD